MTGFSGAMHNARPLLASPAPRQSAAAEAKELFSLECIYGEGVDVFSLPPERRRITHFWRPEEHGPGARPAMAQPLQVGRAFQPELFEDLISGGAARSTISREHFQAASEEAPSWLGARDAGDGCKACAFFLTNLSGNGTVVNGSLLKGRGELCPLRHGDVVTLARSANGSQAKFIEFRFDLSRSCLREAWSASFEEVPAALSPRSSMMGVRVITKASIGATSPPMVATTMPLSMSLNIAPLMTSVAPVVPSLIGARGNSSASLGLGSAAGCRGGGSSSSSTRRPSVAVGKQADGVVFVLEVRGPAVHEQIPVERRRIPFVPPCDGEGREPRLYSSLILGRAHQHSFWSEVLHCEAFDTLSRQHLEVQTWSVGSFGRYSFRVRNLSDVNHVHLRSKGMVDEPPAALACGEQEHLLDGDELILNLCQDTTFSLVFRDVTASTPVSPFPVSLQADHLSNTGRVSLTGSRRQVGSLSAGRDGSRGRIETALLGNPFEVSSGRVSRLRQPTFLLKDEDEVSTATPHDLHAQEEAEEGDVGAGGYLHPEAGSNGLGRTSPSPSKLVVSRSLRDARASRPGFLSSAASQASTSMCTSVAASSAGASLPKREVRRQDDRGPRRPQPSTWSSSMSGNCGQRRAVTPPKQAAGARTETWQSSRQSWSGREAQAPSPLRRPC